MSNRKLACLYVALLFVAILILTNAPAGKAEAPTFTPFATVPLRVMSWNTQFGEGTDAVTSYDRTTSWIASVSPDLVGLCEVPADAVPVIVALLTAKTGHVWFPHFMPKYIGTTAMRGSTFVRALMMRVACSARS